MSTTLTHTEKKKTLAPKLRFKEFNEEWKRKFINDLSSKLNVGFVGTCEPFYTSSSEGVLLVRTGNLKGVNIILDEEKYVTKEFHNKNKKSQIISGDLLLARHGGNGEICMVPKGFPDANSLNIVILRTNSELVSEYFQLAYSSFSVQKQISSVTAGSTQGVINTSEIGKLEIVFPTLPEQQKIATFLSAVDEKIQQLSRKKQLLEQYKKGVMQQLFSGKLRFKDENGKAFPKWEVKRLGEVATFYNGKAYTQTELLDIGKYKVLRVGNFFSNSSWYYSDLELEANKYCDNGDLLYAWSASFGPKIWDGDKTIYHYHIWKVENNNLITKQFLFHILNNETEVIKTRSSNGFALLHITKGTIESWKCNIPSIDEQKVISSFVDQLNKRLESVTKQITQTQTFKKGLLQQMFV